MISSEEIELIEMIDPTAPGCRIVPKPLPSIRIPPGQSVVRFGYELGVGIRYRPLQENDRPRTALGKNPLVIRPTAELSEWLEPQHGEEGS